MSIHKCEFFQHDGAPCHTAKTVGTWLQESSVEVLSPWPGSSPDLNPIENCWAIVKKKVAAHKLKSAADLEAKIKEVWCRKITGKFNAIQN